MHRYDVKLFLHDDQNKITPKCYFFFSFFHSLQFFFSLVTLKNHVYKVNKWGV